MKRISIFGDVHGDAVELRKFIDRIRSVYGDVQFRTLGDLIDRGLNSKEVVQICIDEGVQGVFGNHELWIRDLIKTGQLDSFPFSSVMGGKATMISYGIDEAMLRGQIDGPTARKIGKILLRVIPDSHKEFFLSLKRWDKVVVNDETVWLTHNSIKHDQMMSMMSVAATEEGALDMIPDSSLWPPTQHWHPHKLYKFKSGFQVFGHSPKDEAEIALGFVALDTGCGTCSPYKLSGLLLPDMVLV
jgi:hypothetical protein